MYSSVSRALSRVPKAAAPTAFCARRFVQILTAGQPRVQGGWTFPTAGPRPLHGSLAANAISFDDADGYEHGAGVWSRIAGEAFLDWLAPAPGQRWVDVGCGTGAFTQLVVDRCAPASVDGFDPASAQIVYARSRTAARLARFAIGDATAAPYEDARFDIAVMALVLSYVPHPGRAVSEMIRILAPGGLACSYNWDLAHGGAPLAPLSLAMRQAGVAAQQLPSADISSMKATRQLWIDAGLQDVQTRELRVQRRFESFDQLWKTSQRGATLANRLRSLSPTQREQVKARFRENLQQDTSGPITCTARAIAVRGQVPR